LSIPILNKADLRIGVIGLGYVGLPLAVEFGKKRAVVGFDINEARIAQLISGEDKTLEVSDYELKQAEYLSFTTSLEKLKNLNCYIITVPTPIDTQKNPDMTMLFKASEIIGGILNQGDLVIYESTVYPGATEEECVPILEKYSGLKYNKEFYCGYSPERINPGDKEHRLTAIKKVTSGSTPDVSMLVDALYNEIIVAGTHMASSIRIAEAAKVIENTQRDLNIALTNELAIIFNKLGIDTQAVLKAAESKWNFQPYKPGLVGGHCIGVDPYYLSYKASRSGYVPDIILAGRRLNDNMAKYVVAQLIGEMTHRKIKVKGANLLIMGLTFKENCPDLRNTQVINIFLELCKEHCQVDVYDPMVTREEAKRECDIDLIENFQDKIYDGIIIAVAHDQFKEMGLNKIRSLGKQNHVLYDLKWTFTRHETDLRL
tara:strand:+ start:1191 stop:2480 length:1290 start_codon:yes stop_codon:yes gene_type:complete